MGAPFGLPPTATALDAYLEILDGCDVPWAVSVVGGDVIASDVAGLALERGGHLHLGLEFYGGDRPPTNVELVAEAVALLRGGRSPGRHPRRGGRHPRPALARPIGRGPPRGRGISPAPPRLEAGAVSACV